MPQNSEHKEWQKAARNASKMVWLKLIETLYYSILLMSKPFGADAVLERLLRGLAIGGRRAVDSV